MNLVKTKIGELISSDGIFTDGDWVESKDQDPNGSVRLVQLANVGVGKFINKSSRFMNEETASKLKCTFLEKGDILVARMPDPIGRACIFSGLDQPAVTVVDICVIRPCTDEIDSRWLMHLINSPGFHQQILRYVTGTTRQRISRGNLAKLKVFLPPLEEQKRIAAILDKADTIRRKRQQAIELTDQFLRSVFLDMFGDPVTNPNGWELRPLSEFISLTGGAAFKSTDYCKEGIPLVRIGNANKGYFDDENFVYLPDAFKNKNKRFVLHQGDLLITLTGTVGKDDYGNLAKVSGKYSDYFLNQRVARINFLNDTLSRSFLTQFLSYPEIKSKIIGVSRGVRQANIKNDDILNLEVPIPPKELVDELTNVEDSLTKIISRLSSSLTNGDSLFYSLQQQAFKGELTQSKVA